MEYKKISSLVFNWSSYKICGKSFDDQFKIDGIPLGWFYKKLFLPHVMPGPVNPFELILKEKELTAFNRVKMDLSSHVLKKYFQFNEASKIKYMNKVKGYSDKDKVLFLTYSSHMLSDGKIFRIQSIVDSFKGDQDLEDFVLFCDALSSRDYKKISRFNNIYSYYDEEISKKSKSMAMELSAKWKLLDDEAKYNAFKIDGKSKWPYLKYACDFYFSKEFIYFLSLYYEIFKKIIIKENVKVIVLTSSIGLFERCILAAAMKLNMPSIEIQHGIGLGYTPVDDINPSEFAVFGEKNKNWQIESGAKPEKIHIVGPVIFDDIYDFIKPKNKKGKNILIATACYVEANAIKKGEYFRRMELVLKEIQKVDGVKIVIKLHPRESCIIEYKNIIKKNGYDNVEVVGKEITREKFYEFMQWCDVFIGTGSSAAVEAMIMDKPILTVNVLDDDLRTGWIEKENIGVNINYLEDVKEAVEKTLLDEDKFKIKRRHYVKDWCGTVDGKSYLRVHKLIKNLNCKTSL